MFSNPSKTRTRSRCFSGLAAAVFVFCALLLDDAAVSAENSRVTFPATIDRLIHYTTVKRGDVTEHMLTTQEAIDAVRLGQPLPNGTHVVLVDYRDDKVFRYFVMQKGAGWGADFAAARRTGDWQFQAFKPDKTVNLAENPARCQSCHQSREDSQYLYTFNDLKRFKP